MAAASAAAVTITRDDSPPTSGAATAIAADTAASCATKRAACALTTAAEKCGSRCTSARRVSSRCLPADAKVGRRPSAGGGRRSPIFSSSEVNQPVPMPPLLPPLLPPPPPLLILDGAGKGDSVGACLSATGVGIDKTTGACIVVDDAKGRADKGTLDVCATVAASADAITVLCDKAGRVSSLKVKGSGRAGDSDASAGADIAGAFEGDNSAGAGNADASGTAIPEICERAVARSSALAVVGVKMRPLPNSSSSITRGSKGSKNAPSEALDEKLEEELRRLSPVSLAVFMHASAECTNVCVHASLSGLTTNTEPLTVTI